MEERIVVGYCRVSTDGQVGKDKYGIEAQQSEINAYCKNNGLKVLRWYVDEAVSGASDISDRPALTQLLNGDIQNPPIEAVIVSKNDRLARNIENFYGFKYLLKRNNIDVISVAEDFGEFGMYQPIYEAISTAFAQLERNFIAMRMSGGRMAKAAKGGFAGGKAPLGYKAERGSKKLVIEPKEAELVRLIYKLREKDKMTMKQIAETVNGMGYRNRAGKPFAVSGIQSILENKLTYQGFYRYGPNGEWVKGQQEAILDKENL